jgi:hypothetical protein
MAEPPSDNLPVLASAPEARPIERPVPEPMPLAAPVAVATGGVLAGIGAMVVARVLRNGLRRSHTVRVGSRRRGAKLEVAHSRSFLVDVHVLNRR